MLTVSVDRCAVIGVRVDLVRHRVCDVRPLQDGTPVLRGRGESRQGKQPGEQPVQPNSMHRQRRPQDIVSVTAISRTVPGQAAPFFAFPQRPAGCLNRRSLTNP